MREEDARVEEETVAELAHTAEEPLRADLLVEEPERSARSAARVAAGGLHPPLLREHPHATRRLRLEVRPHRSSDATRDDELAVGCRHETHERVDALAELTLPCVQTTELGRAGGVASQHGGIGRRVDVEERGRRPLELTRREPALLMEPPRQRI